MNPVVNFRPTKSEYQLILKWLKYANTMVSIDDIVIHFNENSTDYTQMSDMDMYIEYFKQLVENTKQ